MPKIMGAPEKAVSDMLKGFVTAHPHLHYDPDTEVIYRKSPIPKVAVISGGGSGHEPAHAGYVGTGMLDGAVAGNVFASPSPDRVLGAIEAVDQDKGVLLVIKNYSGDLMNFEMAMELADANVARVIVKDDVAVPESTYSTGRRGVAGTVFVHKVAGAAAESGASLEEVQTAAQKAADNVRSFGVSLSSCVLPGLEQPGFVIPEGQMEVGMGIHGEPGIEKREVLSAGEIAAIMTEKICADLEYGDREVAVMVNGLGGTPLMELYILTQAVDEELKKRNITPIRYYVGNYMTSLEMAGASLSLLRLDDQLKDLLFAPSDAPAWKEGNV